MPPRRVLWLVPILLAVHNAEEALFFPRYLPFVLARLPAGWQALAAPLTTGQVWSALAIVTAAAFAVAWWAHLRPASRAACWLLLVMQTTLLINAIWHLTIAIVLFRGYAPGLVTALILNLPFSLTSSGARSSSDGWADRGSGCWSRAPSSCTGRCWRCCSS